MLEIKRLELSEMKEQYRHKMDYSRCVASIEIEAAPHQTSVLTNDDTYTTNMTAAMIDDEYDQEVYEYNIVIDSKDMRASEERPSDQTNCDQHSCKLELQKNNNESPGFFGAITKLLQPLFALEL